MLDQIFEGFRKGAESSLHIQQDILRASLQAIPGVPNVPTMPGAWARNMQKAWLEATLELLSEHRAAVDANCRSTIEIVEQALRTGEAQSPDDYRRTVEDLSKKVYEIFQGSSEKQFRDFQKWVDKSFEMAQKNGQA